MGIKVGGLDRRRLYPSIPYPLPSLAMSCCPHAPRPSIRQWQVFDFQVKNILGCLEDLNNGIPEDNNDNAQHATSTAAATGFFGLILYLDTITQSYECKVTVWLNETKGLNKLALFSLNVQTYQRIFLKTSMFSLNKTLIANVLDRIFVCKERAMLPSPLSQGKFAGQDLFISSSQTVHIEHRMQSEMSCIRPSMGSMRSLCGSARGIDKHKEQNRQETHEFTQVRATVKRKTLLLLCVLDVCMCPVTRSARPTRCSGAVATRVK